MQNRIEAKQTLLEFLKSVQHNEKMIVRDAKTKGIIYTLELAFPEAVSLTKNIAPLFKRKTDKETVFAVWNFLRKQIIYERDAPGRQDIRKPNRFLWENVFGTGGGDCKSFSLFSAAVLYNLGFHVAFRYAMYTQARSFSHVYCIAKKNNQEFICDGVYSKFNQQKEPFLKLKTHYMNTYILGDAEDERMERAMQKVVAEYMATPQFKRLPSNVQRARLVNLKKEIQRKVSTRLDAHEAMHDEVSAPVGVTDFNDDSFVIAGKGKKKKLTKEEKKARRKRIAAKAKKIFKGIGRGLMTVTLAAGRGAFLACLAMNLNGMGQKFQRLIDKNEFAKIEETWRNLGGFPKILRKTIDYAKKKKPIFLSKKAKAKFQKLGLHGVYDEGIGAAPLAAIAAAAIPVIGALIPVMIKAFKKIGEPKQAEEVAVGAESAVEVARPVIRQELVEAGQSPSEFNIAPGQSETPEGGESSEGGEEASQDGFESEIGTFDFSSLTDSLSNLASAGITAAGAAIQRKIAKKKGAKKALEDNPPSDEHYMQTYQKVYKLPAPNRSSGGGKMSMTTKLAIGAAVVVVGGGVAYLALKKK